MTLNDYAKLCYEKNHHWWHDADGRPLERNRFELLALIHSEISEAMEGERKGLMDDKLPHRPMAEVELADALIRIFDYAGAYGYDLDALYNSAGRLPDGRCATCGAHRVLPRGLAEYVQAELRVAPENKGEALADIHRAIAVVNEAEAGSNYHPVLRLVDVCRHIFAYAKKHGYDLDGAVSEKMAYNATRADHTHEARAAAGGKKW